MIEVCLASSMDLNSLNSCWINLGKFDRSLIYASKA